MGDPINSSGAKDTLRPVPELPARLVDLFPIVVVGTVLWLAGLIVLGIRCAVTGQSPDVWLWTTVAGVVISCMGLGIMSWQRAAARRGSRGAQNGL
ncbi:DUF2530 domain-containing protein [Amycolatopsis taiwanensis]|uniref:DUF2530 domain-containing protein n=1 Tax=Amycolatopsis taiwanensis TaxID=342230 RepID=A0A9W6R466_9PSEU|nr:DUF2530 domain-containing protein [Amycolatopsis taiwanensis]GLY69176.1 hypothetical protein Atai01_57950 [Amycolatopsis taiwanensis]